MNLEFHYYSIYALAAEAGFPTSEASILASASQLVDNMHYPVQLDTPQGRLMIKPTQNYTFWSEEVRDQIYLPFHFLPGDQDWTAARRVDGASNAYAVSPNGGIAKELLIEALTSKDLYQIGIALHAFADTWAHQNFSGRNEDWNRLETGEAGNAKSGLSLPPAGHLQALTWPDDPPREWTDPRLRAPENRVRNHQRYRQAAAKIYRYLCVNRGKGWDDEELVLDSLESIWRKPDREERFADYVIGWEMDTWTPSRWKSGAGLPVDTRSDLPGYDKLSWLKNTISETIGLGQETPTLRVGTDFFSSDLYRWHLAAERHRGRAQDMLRKRGLL